MFVIRDLVHIFEWGLEDNKLEFIHLGKAIKIYFDEIVEYEFSSSRHEKMWWEKTFEYYQRALKYLHHYHIRYENYYPFCCKIFISASTRGIPSDPETPEERWFLKPEEYEKLMEEITKQTFRILSREVE